MPDEELDNLIAEVIKSTNANSMSDMGKVIKEVMSRAQGAADGSEVSNKVKQALS